MPTAQRIQPLQRLAEIHDQIVELQRERLRAVADARRENHSWAEIAEAVGTSRQSAWELFRDEVETIRRNREQSDLSEDEALEIAHAATNEARRRRLRASR